MEALAIRVEDARESDLDLVRDAWRRAYRGSPLTSKWPSAAYGPFIAHQMDRLIPRSTIRVARPIGEWEDGILGWVVAEQLPDAFALHFAWTRDLFRRQRVMTRLIESFEPRGKRVFTHLRPPHSGFLKGSLGFTWSPDHAT